MQQHIWEVHSEAQGKFLLAWKAEFLLQLNLSMNLRIQERQRSLTQPLSVTCNEESHQYAIWYVDEVSYADYLTQKLEGVAFLAS